jgi:hypothetical protein
MKYFRTIILFMILSLGYSLQVAAQLYFPEDMVKVSGQLIDESNGENIAYAQVINLRVHGSTISDTKGNFSIQADPSDTLTIRLLGYKDKVIPVKEVLAKSKENTKIALTPIKFPIDQVEVQGHQIKMNLNGIPMGKTNSVPSELRSEDYDSKPGILKAITNPISYLHYNLSSNEKEKRTTLAAIHSERQWQILSLIYNKDVVQRITFLTGEKLDDFMVYCNAYNGLQPNATTYDVEKRVKDLYAEYLKLHSDQTKLKDSITTDLKK